MKRYILPTLIIITGIIISAVLFSIRNPKQDGEIRSQVNTHSVELNFKPGAPENASSFGENDYVLGNPNAPVKIIEFSDLECPFCKIFHNTMWEIMNTYGKAGKVAWAYRHFPVDSLHSKARKEAVAVECAGELGGGNAFWEYIDRIFEVTPSNNGLDLSVLPEIAEDLGINRVKFEECLLSGRYDESINNDLLDAIDSGASGTPYSVVIARDGRVFSMPGSHTYSTISKVIETALRIE